PLSRSLRRTPRRGCGRPWPRPRRRGTTLLLTRRHAACENRRGGSGTTMTMAWMGFLLALAAPAAAASSGNAQRAEAYFHFCLGQQARLSGDVTESLQEYRKAQKLDPGAGEVRAEIARLLQEAGRLDEAVAEAKEPARLPGDSAESHLALAQLYRSRAEGERAEDAAQPAAGAYWA